MLYKNSSDIMLKFKLIKSTFYHERDTKQKLCNFIMDAEQLSLGEQCASFEKGFALWHKRKYCVLFNSGSSANLALIQALRNLARLNENDPVGFSAITWATNVMPLIQHSLTPVPLDIEITSLNTSPSILEKALQNTKLKALFITHLLGFSDDIATIKKICDDRGIMLLEDTCEALGSEYAGTKLGNFGLASTFSFFVGHHMSTIEGGAVCTDDEELYQALLMTRSHGWDRHLATEKQRALRTEHHVDDFYAKYTFYDLAYNIRPTEIQGFLGRNQLPYLGEIIDRREKNFEALSSLYKNPRFEKISSPLSKTSNFAFPLICKTKEIKEEYIKKCKEAGIEIRPIISTFMPEQPFFKKYVDGTHDLPNALLIHRNGFYFGNHPEITEEELQTLLETFS